MIPRRIRLRGFLSYRDEQELDFTEANLWMLSGANGSGKSAIFDALTFALYGQHRGGGRNATDLIHKSADFLSVDFEFELDGRWYRARRTVSRRGQGRATQQILEWSNEAWHAVPETQRREGFERWVHDRLGLTYDAFSSSVLLLQGRAEKLLDSTPKGRAEVLAQLVDLSRYQRLFELADAERKNLKARIEALQLQLSAIPEVTLEEIAQAKSWLDEQQGALDRAIQIGKDLSALRVQALAYSRLCQKRSENLERLSAMEALLAQQERINQAWERWQLLGQVVPVVETIMSRRADIKAAETRLEGLSKQIADHEKRRELKSNECQVMARKYGSIEEEILRLSKELESRERQRQELNEPLALIQKLELLNETGERLKFDMASIPGDLTEELAVAQRELSDLLTLERGLKPLSQFAEARDHLRHAIASVVTLNRESESVSRMLKESQDAVDRLRAEAESMARQMQSMRETAASQKAIVERAADALRDFDSLEGAPTCRLCGQPLTADHIAAERSLRQTSWRNAESAWTRTKQQLDEAEKTYQHITSELRRQEAELARVQKQYRELSANKSLAEKDVEGWRGHCQRMFDLLPDSFRSRVAGPGDSDWTATSFPSEDDLRQLLRLLEKMPEVRRREEHLRDLQSRVSRMTLEMERCRNEINSLQRRLSDDPQSIRAKAADLERDIQALRDRLGHARIAERECREQLKELSDSVNQIDQTILRLTGQMSLVRHEADWLQRQVAELTDRLPPAWRSRLDQMGLAELHRLQVEMVNLKNQGVAEQFQKLQRARIEVDSARQTLREIDAEMASIPESATRDLGEIDREIEAATRNEQHLAKVVERARDAWRGLESKLQQRLKCLESLSALEVEHLHAKTLAELLGRDRLQRDLVRRAERQVVGFANAILDRLSGGTLYLRIAGEDQGSPADQALQLEAIHRASGERPIPVAYLSGSQRFRVAVSLALGMGQFASQSHRPLESIIIDEGFGCLDREGRQAMIQELHQLRGLLRCILLVSHQEEFASAFTDGYQFELVDGSTVVRRVWR